MYICLCTYVCMHASLLDILCIDVSTDYLLFPLKSLNPQSSCSIYYKDHNLNSVKNKYQVSW